MDNVVFEEYTCGVCGTTTSAPQPYWLDYGPYKGTKACKLCYNHNISNREFLSRKSPTSPNDPVSHPAHYTSDPSGIECIQITRHRNFNIGNAIKYLWRAGLKDTQAQVEDLKKAIWYINDEIERLQTK